MAATPEGKTKKKVDEILARHELWSCMPMGDMFGAAGKPDYLCCVKQWQGRMLAIETKAKGTDNVTALQAQNLREIEAMGGLSIVVDMDNYELLDHLLAGRHYEFGENAWRVLLRWRNVYAPRITA